MVLVAGKSPSTCLWLFALLLLGRGQGVSNTSQMKDVNVPKSWPPFPPSIETPVNIRRPRASPRLARAPCSAPPQPVNGERRIRQDFCADRDTDCKVLEGTELEPGYELEYTCSTGYRADGSNIVYCRGNGNWSRIPSCVQITCDNLNTVTRVAYCYRSRKSVSCDLPVLPKTQAQVSCRPGYTEDTTSLTLSRRNVLTCNEAGKWEPSPLRCRPVCGQARSRQQPLVIHGTNATIGEFPWHVTLYITQSEKSKKDFICGATLIQTNLLLTAAHCVYDERYQVTADPRRLFVATGNVRREYDDPRHDPDIVRKAAVKNVHVPYTYLGLRGNYASDIALLELEEPFVASGILLPACLDNSGLSAFYLEPGAYGKVAGFGITATGETSPSLQTITVPYIPYSECKTSKNAAANDIFITKDKFCAGYTNGSAVCEGDSGGGLVFQINEQWYVMGVVSVGLGVDFNSGETTCERYAYTLYTRVSEHMDWILKVISDVEHRKSSLSQSPSLRPSIATSTPENSPSSNTRTTSTPKTSVSTQGQISAPAPSACEVPPQPTNGAWKLHGVCGSGVDCDNLQGTAIPPGSKLIYECSPGYKIKGATEVYCEHGGSLSSLPVCIEANGQSSFKCPDDFGFYPHDVSCDKYWKCDSGVAELKICGNGLAFDATDRKFLTENCDYLHKVQCGDRTQLEPPISTPHCARLYGIFGDDEKCDIFWNCWNGNASRYQCSPGLGYDREARICIWADQVPECKTEEIAGGFTCPAPPKVSGASGSFLRYAHPEDCRKYYICLEGVAREYSCPIGTVFKIGDSDGSGGCEDPENVPGCEDYYGDLDLKNIRKSKLSSGIQSSGESRNVSKSNQSKP